MISYDARPLIKITPPQSAKDRRVKTYTFVEAAKRLPCNWPESDVVPILRRINPDLMGQIRTLFIVLSDDQFRRVWEPSRSQRQLPQRPQRPPTLPTAPRTPRAAHPPRTPPRRASPAHTRGGLLQRPRAQLRRKILKDLFCFSRLVEFQ